MHRILLVKTSPDIGHFHRALAARRLVSLMESSIGMNFTFTNFFSFKTEFVTGSRTLSTSFGLNAVLSLSGSYPGSQKLLTFDPNLCIEVSADDCPLKTFFFGVSSSSSFSASFSFLFLVAAILAFWSTMYVKIASRSYKTPSGVTTGSLHICNDRLQQSKSPTESLDNRLFADPKPEFSESFFLSA